MRQKGVGACFNLSLIQMLWSFQSLHSDAALACFEGHSVIWKEIGMKVFLVFFSAQSGVGSAPSAPGFLRCGHTCTSATSSNRFLMQHNLTIFAMPPFSH